MKINPFRAAVGFLVLFISIILFLTTSDLVSWNIWLFIWQFWPILFVVFGIAFLMRRWRLHYAIGLLVFSTIFALTAVGLWLAWENQYFDTENFADFNEQNITESRFSNEAPNKMEEATVKITFGTSQINVGTISDAETTLLYEGTHKSNFFTLNQNLNIFGSKGDLTFKASPFIKRPFNSKSINELNLNFSRKIKYAFDIRSGASDIDLNLENLNVDSLDIDSGASKINVVFGEKSNMDANIKAGASSINLHIPKGLGLRIKTKSTLTSKNFEEFGLVEKNEGWESANWGSATNKVNIELESGISKVELAE